MVKFSKDTITRDTISKIAARAVELAKEHGIEYRQQDAMMDIDAVHSNGNPLRLDDLLAADTFNFAHDIFGIRNCLDRKTGKLPDRFSPRYSVRR